MEISTLDLSRRRAREKPQAVAWAAPDRAWTFGAVETLTNRLANALVALGVGRGDRVACLTRHQPECAMLVLAAQKIGAVCMPVNWRLAAPEVQYIVGDGKARVMMADPEFESVVAALDAPTLRATFATRPGGDEHGDAELTSNPWRPFLQPITTGAVKAIEATGSAIGVTGSAVARSMRIAGDPEKLADVAQAGQRVLVDAAKIALMTSDTQTCLKGVPGVAKGIAWNEPLPLDDVKLVCRALGASVNDVLLSCVAGALRTYLRGRGEDTTGCEIRAMVPVNLRRTDGPIRLGNRFGLVPLELPVGIANPIARLQEVRHRMDDLKGGYQAVLAYTLLEVVGRAPKLVQDPILHYVASKATAVMTNVPGPKEPLSLAGRQLSRMMFWVPQSGDIGLGVSILSYAGGVQFGVIADRKLCPEPQQLIDAFKPEFDALMLICAMLPPDMLGGALDADGLEHALFGEPPKVAA